jgi:hypothetical protein
MQLIISWRQKWWLQLAVVPTRYLLGGAFVLARLIKIKGHRFTLPPAASAPLHRPERLFATLCQSDLYWPFLDFAQLVAGLLLLTQRDALLGALLFLPIVANVCVITVSYDFGYPSIITGAMLLAKVGLLGWDWSRLCVVRASQSIYTSYFCGFSTGQPMGGRRRAALSIHGQLSGVYGCVQSAALAQRLHWGRRSQLSHLLEEAASVGAGLKELCALLLK